MKVWHSLALSLGLLLPVACGDSSTSMPPATPAPPVLPFDLRLQQVSAAVGVTSPMDLQAPPGDARLFIAERAGRIRIVQNGALLTTPFLDISSRVFTGGEAGLLSFTFDPQFSTNHFVYVHFVENTSTNGDIVVERYQVSTDPNILQTPGTGVIRFAHPDATNHYGGRVAFGPDNMLYLSAGDGGGGDNQFMHAQNTTSHLGKLMRIDVSTLPYTIPAGNPAWPIVGQNENWAIGLRNPFRYAFDVPTGKLYIADVGQDQREEIDVVSAAASGLNYGWSIFEGTLCRAIGGPCNTTGLTSPVYEYDHTQGCAIIGGYVYRGVAIPELQGLYLFSDLCSGFVRVSTAGGVVGQALTASASSPVSFGQDGAGELYILTGGSQVLQVMKK